MTLFGVGIRVIENYLRDSGRSFNDLDPNLDPWGVLTSTTVFTLTRTPEDVKCSERYNKRWGYTDTCDKGEGPCGSGRSR